MSFAAAQFEADIQQFSKYVIALETCIAISDHSWILSTIGVSEVSIR